MSGWECIFELLDVCGWLLLEEIVASAGFLAQDSVTQLSPRRLAFFFLARCALAWARRDSPERDPTESHVPLSRSRLGEMESA